MSLASLLEPARVLANVEARSKKHAFEILSELIAGVADDLSHEQIFEALVERERIGNTGLGKGVAIPHGKATGLQTSTAACLKLSEAIDYGAQDGEPVTLILAVAVPDNDDADNFEDVALGAHALTDSKLMQMLNEVSSSRALYELLAAHTPPDSDESEGEQSDSAGDDADDKSDPEDRPKDNYDDTTGIG